MNIICLIVFSNVIMKKINYGKTNITKILGAIAAVAKMDNGTSELSQFCSDLLDELWDEKRKRNKNK